MVTLYRKRRLWRDLKKKQQASKYFNRKSIIFWYMIAFLRCKSNMHGLTVWQMGKNRKEITRGTKTHETTASIPGVFSFPVWSLCIIILISFYYTVFTIFVSCFSPLNIVS